VDGRRVGYGTRRRYKGTRGKRRGEGWGNREREDEKAGQAGRGAVGERLKL